MILALLLSAAIGLTPEAVVWKDGPPTLPAGAKIAVLEGDPRAAGIFTMRVRVPAGATLAPHWHPRDERVTILSGAAELGFGATADPGATKRYGTGSFYVNPPRVMHYLYFPEETVMQMTGIGPWELFTTDIDAKPGAEATGTVALRRIVPAAGSKLSDNATIEATVDYAIDNFRPDSFHLSIQYASTTPNQSFSAERVVTSTSPIPPGPPRTMLTTATGTATIRSEVANALRNGKLARPVRLRVFLHEATGEMSSRVVATTDWVEYK